MTHTDVLLNIARQQERELARSMQRSRAASRPRRLGRLPRAVSRLVPTR
jgi:hypothetical protein